MGVSKKAIMKDVELDLNRKMVKIFFEKRGSIFLFSR